MTGWGQSGPLASTAGHDINYIAITGALHLIGERGRKPVPPLNLVGDFGGGAMMLLAGVLAALLEAGRSGKGQVIDAAMTDGTAALLSIMYTFRAANPGFRDATGEEMLAGAAPYYGTYETGDGKYLAIGSIEPQFYAELIEKLGVDRQAPGGRVPGGTEGLARGRGRDCRGGPHADPRRVDRRSSQGSDACVAPVLSLGEAARHPHNAARGTFIEVDGVEQHAPAPRFSRTAAAPVQPPHPAGADTEGVLRDAGFSPDQIAELRAAGALA